MVGDGLIVGVGGVVVNDGVYGLVFCVGLFDGVTLPGVTVCDGFVVDGLEDEGVNKEANGV